MGQPAQSNQIMKSGWQCFTQDSQAWQMEAMQKCVQSCLTNAEPNMRLETGAVTEIVMKKHRYAEFITWVNGKLTSMLPMKADGYRESLRKISFYKEQAGAQFQIQKFLKGRERSWWPASEACWNSECIPTWLTGANILGKPPASMLMVQVEPGMSQQVHLGYWHLPTTLHGVMPQRSNSSN